MNKSTVQVYIFDVLLNFDFIDSTLLAFLIFALSVNVVLKKNLMFWNETGVYLKLNFQTTSNSRWQY